MESMQKELLKLFDYVQTGNLRSVGEFLNNNTINLNVISPCRGIGILHLAVGVEPLDKSNQCTELILKHGGDPNLSSDDGVTPVHIAAIWGRLDNLKLLIGCGGDPFFRDLDGHSAFDYAAKEQQWDVFDYLHNVIDEKNESFESQCAYTLDLDKVLVTTDEVVAIYENTNNRTNTSYRKSAMIRDWCEKTSLVMNKLYPTIINDTYIINDESAPWTNDDVTLDLTNNGTGTDISYKTCVTSKNIEITGIQPLEPSLETCTCCEKSQRVVYDDFRLPGSPNIVHRNYNTKSNLRSKRDGNDKIVINQSLITEDLNEDLDRALAVEQNKTNEWLSSSDGNVKCSNTRRSSASSGVSSTYSNGSIVLAHVHEEYKYRDVEENVVLIEKRMLVSPVVLPVDDAADLSPDQTIVSIASSLPTSMEVDNNTLRIELMKLGFTPGPIQETTRTLYLKKLKELKKNPVVVRNEGKSYSIELEKSLRSDDWMKNLSSFVELENKVRLDFSDPKKKWREGTAKTSFTYLLVDPRLTSNLPARAAKQTHHVSWVTFVNSIFYVGKGKRSRPYSHLYQAVTLWNRKFTSSKDKKVQHILDIWSDKVGVVCLHIFQNVIPAEAFTYEAAMIDVLGLTNLKNLKSGNYYGVASSWSNKERRMLGLYLLYKAMLIFLSEGERQLRPEDID